MMAAVRRTLRGIAFDMDGTLTQACIDFQLMRQRAGILTGDILEELEKMEPAAQQKARAAIWEVEQEALDRMQIMPGVPDLCRFLDERRIPRGLITRNVKTSVDYFHAHDGFGLAAFSPSLGRECGLAFEPALRFKPHPDSLLHVCSVWGVAPSEAMFVGDSPKDDIVCGNRAGAWTVLLDEEGRYTEADLQGEAKPHFTVSRMSDIVQLLQENFELLPPPRQVDVVEQQVAA